MQRLHRGTSEGQRSTGLQLQGSMNSEGATEFDRGGSQVLDRPPSADRRPLVAVRDSSDNGLEHGRDGV